MTAEQISHDAREAELQRKKDFIMFFCRLITSIDEETDVSERHQTEEAFLNNFDRFFKLPSIGLTMEEIHAERQRPAADEPPPSAPLTPTPTAPITPATPKIVTDNRTTTATKIYQRSLLS